ncbi:cytochrome c maturation protein CcmE [Labedella populi]|uniref:Cytochrome c maturation protein CcmE n=1 Tax=Labedella populi TaxID=2498850 RepID=A0A3S4BDC2_9MICO|nr:cytochrome c maturation protein CcmE [Labedella populi]RWZ67994.1 cytochrome c maturation protein CcmE [Labedella populi]
MTGAPFSPRRRRAIASTILVASCVGLGALALTGANESVTFYLTPTEAIDAGRLDREVRVGGFVVEGSLDEGDSRSSLVLSDGESDMRVVYPGRLPDVIQEGQGAVVVGSWGADDVFLGTEIVMRHSNEYRAPEPGS